MWTVVVLCFAVAFTGALSLFFKQNFNLKRLFVESPVVLFIIMLESDFLILRLLDYLCS